MKPIVKFKRIGDHTLPLPAYATPCASGLDLRSAMQNAVRLFSGEIVAFRTGFAVEIPSGWEGQIRARSGWALRHGITLAQGVGTIDSDFRGELVVLLAHAFVTHHAPPDINFGDRIAQLVIAPVADAQVVEANELGASSRDAGGFGSTGIV